MRIRVNDRPLRAPLVGFRSPSTCPFGSCAPYAARVCRCCNATTNNGGNPWRVLVDVPLVGVGTRARVYRAPAARRLTEGRSLPGDSTLVCAAYHQFPLILNRIQRTKPAPSHPTAAARCVHRYRGARALRIPGVPVLPTSTGSSWRLFLVKIRIYTANNYASCFAAFVQRHSTLIDLNSAKA